MENLHNVKIPTKYTQLIRQKKEVFSNGGPGRHKLNQVNVISTEIDQIMYHPNKYNSNNSILSMMHLPKMHKHQTPSFEGDFTE